MKTKGKFWRKKKVFITGHEGFLGSWLTNTLLEYDADICGLDKTFGRPLSVLNGISKKITAVKGDIANLRLVKTVIQRFKPQVIFHLAAEAIVGESLRNPIRTFRTNIGGTWNILEASRGNGKIEAIVVASSDKAYGTHKNLPYKENAALRGEHPYDVSKSCTDLLCQTYYKTYRLPVCTTRCGNIYGPGDYHFSRLVPDAICSALSNKQFIIRSNGKFTRDYIFVKDIVDGYILLAENLQALKLSGEAFNFSNEEPMNVIDLHKKILNVLGRRYLNPKILNQARYEIPHQYLCSRKARQILGWKSRYSLEKGLKETIGWYKRHV